MILVTGVSGALGGLVHGGLARLADVTAVSGSRSDADRRVDFDDPATLPAALSGVDVLVFVSAGYAEDDVVFDRHGALVDAAARAGVRHVVYTSLVGAADRLSIALPHRWTERRLAEAPFTTTVLRNGLYAELAVDWATSAAETAAATGEYTAPLGTGRVSLAAREDLAEVAVRVAAEASQDLDAGVPVRHAGRTYELDGPAPIGGADLAELLAESVARPVAYRSLSTADLRAFLTATPLLPYQVGHTVSMFNTIRSGLLESTAPGDLAALLDRAPVSAHALVRAALAAR
ncbi:NAD(P)H dehydrogenase (quinone) [Actinocorallia herbida]|uniref:NAD(P)H dehydrogenase (Quinone) n=1 Tax=Actinocorallia herbida TaxID=58109 RepID=A0A3N1CWH0_9ACTN|nr:NmrA family NAD(P)-binding protein [Actinocorallia herbida]ROO85631.1 NAD(P)H dehydrogenase (quinone) [Actinocorallia herbida]